MGIYGRILITLHFFIIWFLFLSLKLTSPSFFPLLSLLFGHSHTVSIISFNYPTSCSVSFRFDYVLNLTWCRGCGDFASSTTTWELAEGSERERGRDIWGCWNWLGSTLLLLFLLLPLLLRFVHTYFHSSAAPTFTYLIFGVSRSARKSTTNCVYPTGVKRKRCTVTIKIIGVMLIFFSFFLIFLSCIEWSLYIISSFILSSNIKKTYVFHR